MARADATYRTLKFTADAYTELVKKDEISKQEATEAVSNAESQAALVSASKREVEAARGALVTAKATAANPAIHLAQTDVLRKQLAKQELQIQAAKSEAARARAELAEAEARLADLTVIAPFDGTVSSRLAEPGEVLSAGTPIVTLINLGGVYLRGFIPEGVAGRVRIGQPAHVYLDSAPAKPLDAIVIRIDPETSFTPENTYFRDDRVKQVIGLKLLIKNAAGFAKPGMPADGEILLQGTHWPKR